jgi:hypothetical protein
MHHDELDRPVAAFMAPALARRSGGCPADRRTAANARRPDEQIEVRCTHNELVG